MLDHFANVQLMAAVKQLHAEQRDCAVLRFLRGLSVAETAQAMGKNEGAIKALQYRAVRALARMFPDATDGGLPAPLPPQEALGQQPPLTEDARVRRWAAENGIHAPRVGRLSSRLHEMYRSAGAR